MTELAFEWDEDKRLATIAKHEIDFNDAVEIFFGPVLFLSGKSEIEARQRAIGILGRRMICVIFTIRDDKIRLITARVARRNEREEHQKLYHRADPGHERPN